MIKILDSNKKNFFLKLNNLLNNRRIVKKSNSKIVQKIIEDVKINGFKGLKKYEKIYSSNDSIKPSKKEINKAIRRLDPKVKRAIDFAYNKISDFLIALQHSCHIYINHTISNLILS